MLTWVVYIWTADAHSEKLYGGQGLLRQTD